MVLGDGFLTPVGQEKTKGAENLLCSLIVWRFLRDARPIVLLVKRVQRHASIVGARICAAGKEAHHGILNRTETAVAGLVDNQRDCSRYVLHISRARRCCHKSVTAFATSC